jgi:hypothetical protein
VQHALMSVAVTLVDKMSARRATDGTAGDQTLSRALEDAHEKIRAATNVVVECGDAEQKQQEAAKARVEVARAVERRDAARARAAADAQAAVDNTKARWDERVMSAVRRIVQRDRSVRVSPFARVHISMLTREIERSGDVTGQSRVAFYTDVAARIIS